jgi:hypothetical protein
MLAVLGTTLLRKVTVRTSEPDALAVRTQCERASTGPVDLHPASLPRSAVLCVRALRDCSRRLSFRATQDFAALNRCRQTTVAALDALPCAATCPARGPVRATAEAVLFADDTELLACLDRCRGGFAEHWWWRSILRRARLGGRGDGRCGSAAPIAGFLLSARACGPRIRRKTSALSHLEKCRAIEAGMASQLTMVFASPSLPYRGTARFGYGKWSLDRFSKSII